MAEVGVVIVNYRTPALVENCVASLERERAANPGLRIVVVEGGSADGSVEAIATFIAARGWEDWVRLVPLDINGGFGFANNHGVAALAIRNPDHILFVNPDAEVSEGAVGRLVALMEAEPRCGAVGANIVSTDGEETSCAFENPTILRELCRAMHWAEAFRLLRQSTGRIQSAKPVRADWVSGAAVMMRTRALADSGLFDDGFFLYFEEGELMHRLARKDWQVWHQPEAVVRHIGSAATGIYSGGNLRPQPLPRYWFESRRRYYVRTRGAGFAVGMALAAIAGESFHALTSLILSRANLSPRRYLFDLARYTLVPRRRDFAPSVPPLTGPVPATPAWAKPS